MKYIKLPIYIILFFFSTIIYSQNNNGENDKLKSLKIGFITQKLDLSSKEAQGFWPVYNKHQEEIHKLRSQDRKMRREIRQNGGIETITDSEAERILTHFLDIDAKIKQEELKMYGSLKPILPAKKILILNRTEQDFNRRILEQLKKKRLLKKPRN